MVRALVRLVVCVLMAGSMGDVARGLDILYISTTPSRSHHIWDKTVAQGLIERNHNITFLTHSPEKKTKNFTPIQLEGVYEKLAKLYDLADWLDYGPMKSINVLFDWLNLTCSFDLQTAGIQTLIKQAKTGIKYDVILIDGLSGHCLYPLIEMFGSPPVVVTSPYGLQQFFTFPFAIDLHVAHNPLNFLTYTDQMSFVERACNLFYTLYYIGVRQFVYMPSQQKIAEEFFGKDISPLDEIEKRFSLLLVNTDPVFDYPQAVPPAVQLVGGLHTRRAKALPQDLHKYLDDSKEGVVLFALGSNIRSDKIGKKEIETLIHAFSQLKQNVMWKFESEIENLPKNILIRNWLPQNDILAHPNVKLFITHGGGLSTQEAMYHGVPVVGIPFFVDQHVNMARMVARKLGVKIDFKNITTQNVVLDSINEVLTNPIYKNNAVTTSKRYRDQPMDALSRAVHWVEYVARHGGEHLHVATRDMAMYQVLLLDVWAAILAVILGFIYIVKRLCRSVKSGHSGSNKKKVKKN